MRFVSAFVCVCALVAVSTNGFLDDFVCRRAQSVCGLRDMIPCHLGSLRLWSLRGVHSGRAPERREGVAAPETALLTPLGPWERRIRAGSGGVRGL